MLAGVADNPRAPYIKPLQRTTQAHDLPFGDSVGVHYLISKQAYREPSEVDEVLVSHFVDQLRMHLIESIGSVDIALGHQVSSLVDKMVPPTVRDQYRKIEQVIGLATFEVDQIAQKIRRYQYIERYSFFFDSPNSEIGIGFAEHMYSLRNSELYGILERGEHIVRFVSAIGSELNVGSSKASSKYAKLFKEKFERRLRERHRMTHAHERRSLVSRLFQIAGAKTEEQRDAVGNVLGDVVGTVNAALEMLQERMSADDRAPSAKDPKDFQVWYLKRVDREAATMWRTFSYSVASAAGMNIVE